MGEAADAEADEDAGGAEADEDASAAAFASCSFPVMKEKYNMKNNSNGGGGPKKSQKFRIWRFSKRVYRCNYVAIYFDCLFALGVWSSWQHSSLRDFGGAIEPQMKSWMGPHCRRFEIVCFPSYTVPVLKNLRGKM